MSDFETLVLADEEEDKIILVDDEQTDKPQEETVVVETPDETADIVLVEDEKKVDSEPKLESKPEPKPARPKAKERIDTLVRKLRETERERDRLNNMLQMQRQSMEEQHKNRETQIEQEIELTKKAMQKAFDDGDAAALVEHQDRLIKLQSPMGRAVPPPPTPTEYTPPQQEQTWIARSGFTSWPAPAQTLAQNLYNHLKLSYQPDDPELYNEVDRRLKKQPQFQELYDLFGLDMEEDLEEEPTENNTLTEKNKQSKIKKPTVGTPRSGGPVSTVTKGTVVLTEEDKRTMRLFNFDPTNPEQVKSFLKHGKGLRVNG